MSFETLDLAAILTQHGPLMVVLLWFMFRLERILGRFDKHIQLIGRAMLRQLERDNPKAAEELSKDIYRVNGNGE